MIPPSMAAFHYWRSEREKWPLLLDRIVQLGFEAVDTYVPWAIHMPVPEKTDWGEKDPTRDLAAFLDLCQERGLAVSLRPGPQVNAELPNFGFPAWVLDDPLVQALGPDGKPVYPVDISVPPFPTPSYASEAFFLHTAVWLDEVLPRIRPYLKPNGGPVAMVQVDNDLGYFFRPEPFDLDYHPDAIDLYRRWIGDSDAQPPRRFDPDNIPFMLSWCRFKEWMLTCSLGRLADMFRERGIKGVPLTLNLPALSTRGVVEPGGTPVDLLAMEQQVAVVGVDLYSPPAAYDNTSKWSRYINAMSRFPFVPEFGAGRADDWPPRESFDPAFNWRTVIMHGVRALCHYMVVERERWIDAPIGPDGALRVYAMLYPLHNALQRSLAGSQKEVDVLVMAVRDYSRLAAVSKLNRARPSDSDDDYLPERWVTYDKLGFSRSIPSEDLEWFRGVEAALTEGGYASDLGDDSLELDRLRKYPAIICPAFDFMTRSTQEKLRDYADGGGNLIYGPCLPFMDEELRPCRLLSRWEHFDSEPVHAQFASRLCAELAGRGVYAAAVRDDADLDMAVHRLPDGRRVLFAANATPREKSVRIEGIGEPFEPSTPPVGPDGRVDLAAWSINIWEVEDETSAET